MLAGVCHMSCYYTVVSRIASQLQRGTLFDLGVIKLFLNESDFSTFQKKILPYKSYGVNPLDLTGFQTEGVLFHTNTVKY